MDIKDDSDMETGHWLMCLASFQCIIVRTASCVLKEGFKWPYAYCKLHCFLLEPYRCIENEAVRFATLFLLVYSVVVYQWRFVLMRLKDVVQSVNLKLMLACSSFYAAHVVLSLHLWCFKHIVLLKTCPWQPLTSLPPTLDLEQMLIFLYRIDLLCFWSAWLALGFSLNPRLYGLKINVSVKSKKGFRASW